VLAGLVIAVTGISYLLNMEFQYQWLVWIIGAAFIGVGLITVEWLRTFKGTQGDEPKGGLRIFLLLAIPLSYIIDSQICGLGLKACNTSCHILSYVLLALAAVIAIQLYRNKPVTLFLIPTVILSLIPHCTCHAPINVIWHNLFSGIAPTCFVMPLAVVLFSLTALRGFRTRLSTILVVLMLIVITFCAVGNALFGFPWPGCIH
jgi:hypothetical protein